MSWSPLFALVPSDTLAFAMVAILSFALGMIVTIFFTMIRTNSGQPEIDADDLLEDEEEEEEEDYESSHNVGAGDPPKEPRESWEQDPDWWRR